MANFKKVGKKIFYIILALFVLYLVAVSMGMVVLQNWPLILIILLILILNSVKEFKNLNKKLRLAVFIILISSAIIYLIVPKKIGGCGVGPKAFYCTKCSCIGIPFTDGIPPIPKCIGKLYNCSGEVLPKPGIND